MRLSELLHRAVEFEAPVLPALTKVQAAAKKVFERWPHITAAPLEKDRERIVQEIKRRWSTPDWTDTRMSQVSAAARALFDAERRRRPDLGGLRQFYYDETAVSTRATFLDAMLETYFESFEPQGDHTRKLAEALIKARPHFGARNMKRVSNFPSCLDPAKAPSEISRRMVDMRHVWRELQPLVGAPHAPGLMQHAHLAFVAALAPRLREKSTLEKLFAWLKPDGQRALVSGADKAIEAILAPWREADPAEDLQNYLLDRLIDAYGDPRVKVGEVWPGVDEELRKVVYRWLTGKHIKFFLDVVSAVETGHMWAPRREFWERLFNDKRIADASVALSLAAEQMARNLSRQDSATRYLTFYKQTAGGSRRDISLLVMQIDDKIVVEGSHNYKVHIFPSRHKKQPRLRQSEYDCENIRLSLDEDHKRVHDASGHWRSWVMERI